MEHQTVEAQHGPDCTCPVVTRIETVLVAVADGCPGDRNPHRGAQVVASFDDADWTADQIAEWKQYWDERQGKRHSTALPVQEHVHYFPPVADDLRSAYPCKCGMTPGRYQQLLADEAAGRPHASEITEPVDRYGRASEPVE